MSRYNFVVRLGVGCELLSQEHVQANMPECHEMIVTSESFEDYTECVSMAQNLLTSIGKQLTKITGKKFTIMVKVNPQHEQTGEEVDEVWNQNTYIRIYLAETKWVKKKKLLFTVYANVNVTDEYIKVVNSLTPLTHQ